MSEKPGIPLREVTKMAKGLGIGPHKKKRTELIRAIQTAEDALVCFGTSRVVDCEEYGCLWRYDCLALNDKAGLVDEYSGQ